MYLLRAWYISLIITKFTFKMASFFCTFFLQMGVLKKAMDDSTYDFHSDSRSSPEHRNKRWAQHTFLHSDRRESMSLKNGQKALSTFKQWTKSGLTEKKQTVKKKNKEQRILWNDSCSWRKMFVDFVGHPYPRMYAAK